MSSITREAVLKMDWATIFAAIKSPETSADMQTLLRSKDRELLAHISALKLEADNREAEVDAQLNRVVPPSTEQLAAEASAMATPETPAEAAPVVPPPVATNADDAELKSAGITVTRDASGKATRYSMVYQVTDEDGNAIGRATNLSTSTLVELLSKQKEVHTQATRAFHRLKKQKLTFKQEKPIVLTPEAISEAARVALEQKDSAKVVDVINATIESAYQTREEELRKKELREEGRAISNEFMRRHLHDYNPCDANKKAFAEYFVENNLEFTLDNLEAALVDLLSQEGKLVKVETPFTERQATVTANPGTAATVTPSVAPAIPVAEAVVPVQTSATPVEPQAVVTPAVTTTAPTPVAAPNVQPATRRPGVNGGIAPGTLSAQRPGAPDPALTRKEFLQNVKKMDPQVMKAKLKNDPQFVKQLESYGIRIR